MTRENHADAETKIRAAMRQLLAGSIPDGRKCDVKSLCILSGVPRATLYRPVVGRDEPSAGRHSGRPHRPRRRGGVQSGRTHPATSSLDGTARLWDVATRQTIATLAGHAGPVNSVAFSPDGHTLATGSADDTARLWELAVVSGLV